MFQRTVQPLLRLKYSVFEALALPLCARSVCGKLLSDISGHLIGLIFKGQQSKKNIYFQSQDICEKEVILPVLWCDSGG
jgi:hypothetical protein